MKKGMSTILTGVIVVVVLILVTGGFYFSIGSKSNGGNNDLSGEDNSASLIGSTDLSKCLVIIDESKLPASLGGFTGTPTKTVVPFSYAESARDPIIKMPSEGYVTLYSSGDKSISAAIQKIKSDQDYTLLINLPNKLKSRIESREFKSEKEIIVKGATVFIFILSDSVQSAYIPAGDNIWVQFGFSGTTLEESQNWINEWANIIC